MQSKYLIIINKSANGGATKKIWPEIKNNLDKRHVNYTATSSKYHKNAILITEEYIKLSQPNDILLVIGGDGTLNEVVNASEKITQRYPNLSRLPIGYVPTGKRNEFARSHQISLNWHKALLNIMSSNSVSNVKIGYFDEMIKHQRIYFLNNVGIGLNADLINILHHSKISWRALRYFTAIFNLLYNLQSFTMEMYKPHKTKIYHNVFLANISLDTNPKNHHNFNVTIIERHNILIMFYIFFKLLFKHKLSLKMVHWFKMTQLHLGVPTLEYGHADGEELGDRFYDSQYYVTTYPFIL